MSQCFYVWGKIYMTHSLQAGHTLFYIMTQNDHHHTSNKHTGDYNKFWNAHRIDNDDPEEYSYIF